MSKVLYHNSNIFLIWLLWHTAWFSVQICVSTAYMLVNCSFFEDSFHRECFGISSARKYHPQLSSNGQFEGAAYVVSTNSVVHFVPLSLFHLWNIFQELVCKKIQENAPALLVSSGLSRAMLTEKHKRYINSTVLMLVFSFNDTPDIQKNV